ncbi:MAG: hypothetical protein ING32_12435 [Curvibacter sp.]|nr:hypothetical protein [Curvibacter sp.]
MRLAFNSSIVGKGWRWLLTDTDRRVIWGLWAVIVGLVIHLLWMHLQIIQFPYPLEYRENSDLWRAYLIHSGRNPYSYENYPAANSQYGYVFPWLSSLLFSFTGVSFLPLRLVTFLAILPMMVVFFYGGIKHKVNPVTLLVSLSIVYAVHLMHPGNFLGMPNTLGTTLFTLAVLLPPLTGFRRDAMFMSAVLSAVGLFTKLYFCFGIFYVGLYLLYVRRWRDLLFLSLVSLVVLAASIAVVAFFMPGFLESNVLQNAAVTNFIPKLLWLQTRDFVRVFFAFVVLIVVARKYGEPESSKGLKDPYIFGLLFFGILLLRMGANEGQYYLYFQQLLLPFLVVLFFQRAGKISGTWLVHLLLVWNLAVIYTRDVRKFDLDVAQASFEEIERQINSLGAREKILFNQPLSYFAISRGITPNDHGQVAGMLWTKGEGHQRYIAQNGKVREDIRSRIYSGIFLDKWQSDQTSNIDLVTKCYRLDKVFTLRMYEQKLPVTLWLQGDTSKPCTN